MLLVFSLLVASTSVSQVPSADHLTRPCEAITAEPTETRKARGGKKKGDSKESLPPAPNCVEARMSALDIQEYFQKFVRAQRWSIKEQQASEETWIFTILLDKEKLATYTKPFVNQRIHFRGGKGLVQVRTTEKNEGYTQVLIKATFNGFGESEDMLATRRDVWPLESNGNQESELIHAIELHAQSLH